MSDEFEANSTVRDDSSRERQQAPFTRGALRDPFDTGNNLYSSFRRAQNRVRQSGRHAREQARRVNRSFRYTVRKPIVPAELYRPTDAEGREFISEHEYLARLERVEAPEPEVTENQYATYLRTNVKYGRANDKLLRLLMPTRKERMKFLQAYGGVLSCNPPPLFMILFATMQIAMFVFYVIRRNTLQNGESIGFDTHDSMWIYDPDKRNEAWRWVTYAVLHYDSEHLLGNVLLQILVGFLLELYFKWRICVIFFFGILSGSLASSCVDPHIKLLGSSGGSYAIIGAYLALMLRRFRELPRPMRLLNGAIAFTLLVYVSIDFGLAYSRRYNGDSGGTKISHIAHVAGMFTGWTVGYAILHNFKTKLTTADIAPYLGLVIFIVIYITFVLIAILFNILISPAGNVRGD